MYSEAEKIKEIVDNSQEILIIQADNPDGDSLGSALALECIIDDLGKTPHMYCGVDMPMYLRFLPGWDRVDNELPVTFDASIIVDASTTTLLGNLIASNNHKRLAEKPSIVLDHHGTVENVITFSDVMINDPTKSSAGEVIYTLSKQLQWPLSLAAQTAIMAAILGDTQGLTNNLANAGTYKVMTEMIEANVDRSKLEERRREYGKMDPEILHYKAKLIERTALSQDGKLAHIVIPDSEIKQYSPKHNPAPLIQDEWMRTRGVELGIVFKSYNDGKVRAAIRSQKNVPIAGELARAMGGGGHPNASGFEVNDGRTLQEIQRACLDKARELLESF